MRYLIFTLLCSTWLHAVRDPFSYKDGIVRYVCSAIGSIDNRHFACVYKDGQRYCVRPGDTIHSTQVESINATSVTLRHANGSYELVILAKKGPST